MSFVLDASVALAWSFKDERGPYEMGVLDALRSSEAIVPALWPLEVSHGLLSAGRRGRLEPAIAEGLIRTLLSLPIAVDPGSCGDAFQSIRRLARMHRLTA